VNDSLIAVNAAVAGAGIAHVYEHYAHREIKAGLLQRLAAPFVMACMSYGSGVNSGRPRCAWTSSVCEGAEKGVSALLEKL
jgi:DNA-binding transcriptional LysR family regulator